MTHELLIARAATSDAATLATSSPTPSDMGLAYLQTYQPGDACRFTDGGDAAFTWDAGAAVAWNFVGLLYVTGAGAADTWRIRLADSAANLTAAPGYDSGSLNLWAHAGLTDWPWVHAVRYLSPAQSYRHGRIDLTFSGAALDVGKFLADAAWISPKAADIGYRLNARDTTLARLGQDGADHVVAPGQIYREPGYSWNKLTEAQVYGAGGFQQLVRQLGRDQGCFAWLAPSALTYAQERAVYGRVLDAEVANAVRQGIYRARIQVRELLPDVGIGAV